MHCPQCGQQVVSDGVRFCNRCGFGLDGVKDLLSPFPPDDKTDLPALLNLRRNCSINGRAVSRLFCVISSSGIT